MLISVLFNTHLLHPWWLKFSWIRSSRFMACRTLLFLIATQLSQAIFGKNCSSYKAPNCISAQLIIPRLMVKHEVVNKCLETYLRCFSSEKKNPVAQWLPLVEWWYNTSYHTTTRMTPFEAVYGKKPPSVLSYLPGTLKVQAVVIG
jgi:hypothetical protein